MLKNNFLVLILNEVKVLELSLILKLCALRGIVKKYCAGHWSKEKLRDNDFCFLSTSFLIYYQANIKINSTILDREHVKYIKTS